MQKTRNSEEWGVYGEAYDGPFYRPDLYSLGRILHEADATNPVKVVHRVHKGVEVVKLTPLVEGDKVAMVAFPHGTAEVTRENSGQLKSIELRAKVAPKTIAAVLAARKGVDRVDVDALGDARYLRYEQYGDGPGTITFYETPKNRIYRRGESSLHRVEFSGKAADFVRLVKQARALSDELE